MGHIYNMTLIARTNLSNKKITKYSFSRHLPYITKMVLMFLWYYIHNFHI